MTAGYRNVLVCKLVKSGLQRFSCSKYFVVCYKVQNENVTSNYVTHDPKPFLSYMVCYFLDANVHCERSIQVDFWLIHMNTLYKDCVNFPVLLYACPLC